VVVSVGASLTLVRLMVALVVEDKEPSDACTVKLKVLLAS